LLKIKISDAYVFKVIKIQVAVLWVMTPSSDVVGYQRFGEPCCLHLQCDYPMTGMFLEISHFQAKSMDLFRTDLSGLEAWNWQFTYVYVKVNLNLCLT